MATLNETEASLVRETFADVLGRSDDFSASFYRSLFEKAPEVRELFSKDMTAQREKLIATLSIVVRGARNFDELAETVRELGRGHVGYGARPAHYDVLKITLLETLEQYLGDKFDPQVRAAWSKLIDVVNKTMLEGAATAS